jgi:hypothetical protein
MEPQGAGSRIAGIVPFLYLSRPNPSGGPKLGNLFEEVVMGIEKKG